MSSHAGKIKEDLTLEQFGNLINQSLEGGKFASAEHAENRLRGERKAGRTAKQKAHARKEVRKKVGYRFSLQMIGTMKSLGKHLGMSDTDVLERALDALAKATPGFKG